MKRSHAPKLLAFILIVAYTAAAQSSSPSRTHASNEAAIRAVLEAQSAAWNRGDIEGYMAGYWRSPQTQFVSGNGVTRGWQSVLERYQKRYDSREKMGTLTFSDLEIKWLNNNTALVTGRWHLQRANDEPHGMSTLIVRRTKQGWKIVYDHSSAAN